MKLLVTGGTGFLGHHLVPLLLKAGHSVRLVARQAPRDPALATAEFVKGDLLDEPSVRSAVEGVEGVYHLAGMVSFDPNDGPKMYALHVQGTRTLLRALRGKKLQRFVLASSSGAIAVSKEERVGTEDDDYPITIVGKWPYYLSKIYEEQLALSECKKEEIPLVVLNPSLMLGPGDERLSSTWTIVKFLNGDIPVMPNGGMSFVDVRDAAQAFFNALTQGELYGRHLMGVNMPFTEFFGRLERLTGVSAPKLRLPKLANILGAQLLEKFAKARGAEVRLEPASVDIAEHFFYLDASKAERDLGFSARDPQETLYDTVKYLLDRMPEEALPGTKGRLAELRK